MPAPCRVLILDDDEAERTLLADSLREAGGFAVDTPADTTAYERLPDGAPFDAVLLALTFLGCTWQDLLPAVRARWPQAAVVILADGADIETVAAAVRGGADNYLLRHADATQRVPLALHTALVWARERARSERIQSRLRRFLDEIHVGVFRAIPGKQVLEANAATLRILGYRTLEEMQATPIEERFQRPGERALLLERLRHEGSVADHEVDMRRVDGTPIRVSLSIRLDSRGLMDGLMEEVTERHRAQESQRRSEAELRTLVSALPDLVMVLDREGRYLQIAPTNATLLFRPAAEMLGKTVVDILPPDRAMMTLGLVREALDARTTTVYDYDLEIDGVTRWFHGSFTPLGPDRVLAIARDITTEHESRSQRDASARAARESAERLDLALEAAGGAAWDWDLASGEVVFSPRWALILGFEPGEIGTDLSEWEQRLHPDDADAITRARTAHVEGRHPVYEVEHRLRAKDGSWKYVLDRGRIVAWDAEGRPRRMVGIMTDLSERKRLENQLAQAQKMEAVGQLAGGIAHDFNNVLTAILSTSELVLLELGPTDLHREDIEEIKRSANRAAALTRQLLAYSRRQVLQPRVIDLNGVVTNVDRMLRRLLGAQVTLQASLEPTLGRVRADPGQMEQILVNLAVNASDAMPEGGRLTITTTNVDAIPDQSGPAVDGPHVMLGVSDTGIGMDEATRGRIFEPFFTTKPRSQGTGLGLATVYGIVRQSGGVIRVASEPGAGTTFRIFLPRVEAELEAEAPAPPLLARDAGSRGAAGTILVAEDEEVVRRLARRILEQEGYTVLTAGDAGEAMTLARECQGPIHLLVTDVVMPGRSGVELARDLEQQRPGLRVLFVSGYPETTRGRWQPPEGWGAFLQKPFTPNELLDAVRAATTASPAVSAEAAVPSRPDRPPVAAPPPSGESRRPG